MEDNHWPRWVHSGNAQKAHAFGAPRYPDRPRYDKNGNPYRVPSLCGRIHENGADLPRLPVLTQPDQTQRCAWCDSAIGNGVLTGERPPPTRARVEHWRTVLRNKLGGMTMTKKKKPNLATVRSMNRAMERAAQPDAPPKPKSRGERLAKIRSEVEAADKSVRVEVALDLLAMIDTMEREIEVRVLRRMATAARSGVFGSAVSKLMLDEAERIERTDGLREAAALRKAKP